MSRSRSRVLCQSIDLLEAAALPLSEPPKSQRYISGDYPDLCWLGYCVQICILCCYYQRKVHIYRKTSQMFCTFKALNTQHLKKIISWNSSYLWWRGSCSTVLKLTEFIPIFPQINHPPSLPPSWRCFPFRDAPYQPSSPSIAWRGQKSKSFAIVFVFSFQFQNKNSPTR